MRRPRYHKVERRYRRSAHPARLRHRGWARYRPRRGGQQRSPSDRSVGV